MVNIREVFAKVLNVEIYELFLTPHFHTSEIDKTRQITIDDIKDIVKEAVSEVLEKEKKKRKSR